MEYEINFLVLQSNTEKLDQTRTAIKNQIEAHEGKVTDSLEYKKRKLSYEIKHEQYGFYTVFRFTAEGNETIEKIKRDINLIQTVSRYIIVRADGLSSLKDETPGNQERMEMASKNTIKQEEVDQILSGKKTIAPKPKTPAKETPHVEEKMKQETEVKKEEVKKEEIEKEVSAQEKKPKEEEASSAKEENQAEEKKKEEDKPSLDELDKKLDEILNS